MNKTFATFTQGAQEGPLPGEHPGAPARCCHRTGASRPTRSSERDLHIRDLYNFADGSYWLRRLENHGRKERVLVDEYTIEHILPQNENLPVAWKKALGSEWERVQETWLHTLGNLTLTGYNAEYSDRPFTEKRDMEGGFKESPLKLNAGLGQLETWNEETIKERADRLADELALKVWGAPKLAVDVLAAYKPNVVAGAGYTIADHPQLLTPALREVFEGFRKAVLALNPCVTEEFLKLYVAYKADPTVDVVPRGAPGLGHGPVAVNCPSRHPRPGKKLCKDVTQVGRWGNGDVEVSLATLDELPYVMGLVRQSFERQMEGAGDE